LVRAAFSRSLLTSGCQVHDGDQCCAPTAILCKQCADCCFSACPFCMKTICACCTGLKWTRRDEYEAMKRWCKPSSDRKYSFPSNCSLCHDDAIACVPCKQTMPHKFLEETDVVLALPCWNIQDLSGLENRARAAHHSLQPTHPVGLVG
jgi:hypothetical protein